MRRFLRALLGIEQVERKEWETLMANFSNLNTSINTLSEKVDALIAAKQTPPPEDPQIQQQIDAAQAAVDGIVARATAAGV